MSNLVDNLVIFELELEKFGNFPNEICKIFNYFHIRISKSNFRLQNFLIIDLFLSYNLKMYRSKFESFFNINNFEVAIDVSRDFP